MRDVKTIALQNKFALTVDEVSIYTGIGNNTIRALIKNQKLQSLTIGKKNLIRRDVLEKFLIVNEDVNLLDFENVKKVD